MKRLFRSVPVLLLSLYFLFLPLQNGMALTTQAPKVPPAGDIAVGKEQGRVMRLLLLGCDRSAGLADSICILSFCEDSGRASLVQIPRDTYAEYTQKDYKKLNGAVNALGADGMKVFLSSALGVPIDYYAVLDLSVLKRLVDAVGGVDVDIPQEMLYEDEEQNLHIALSKGRTHLDGAGAEQFVRFRSGYANADLGRLDAQKLFLKSFFQQCSTLSGGQLWRLTRWLLTGVQTDVSLPDAFKVVSMLRQAAFADMPMETAPGEAVQGNSGAWYYVLCRKAMAQTVQAYLFADSAYTEECFDVNRVFDRPSNKAFHKIYSASSP